MQSLRKLLPLSLPSQYPMFFFCWTVIWPGSPSNPAHRLVMTAATKSAWPNKPTKCADKSWLFLIAFVSPSEMVYRLVRSSNGKRRRRFWCPAPVTCTRKEKKYLPRSCFCVRTPVALKSQPEETEVTRCAAVRLLRGAISAASGSCQLWPCFSAI